MVTRVREDLPGDRMYRGAETNIRHLFVSDRGRVLVDGDAAADADLGGGSWRSTSLTTLNMSARNNFSHYSRGACRCKHMWRGLNTYPGYTHRPSPRSGIAGSLREA